MTRVAGRFRRTRMSEHRGTLATMPLDPDTAIRVSLIGTADRLAYARGDRDAAITELQRIASGRTDLLAQAAGHYLGGQHWNRDTCLRLLMDAGADPKQTVDTAEQVRWNLEHHPHTTIGTQSRRSTLWT